MILVLFVDILKTEKCRMRFRKIRHQILNTLVTIEIFKITLMFASVHYSSSSRLRVFQRTPRSTWTRRWVSPGRKLSRGVVYCAQKESERSRRGGNTRTESNDWDPKTYDYPPPRNPPPRTISRVTEPEPPAFSNFTNAIIVGAFVLGIGAGVYFTSEVKDTIFEF